MFRNFILQLALLASVASSAAVVTHHFTSTDTNRFVRPDVALATDGSAELDYGVFSGWQAATVAPESFVWSYDDNGTQVEVWALFRPGQSNGWVFPGPSATSVDLEINYENVTSPSSVSDFLDWCEDQYPTSWNVDKDVDFEVHEHRVTVLQ